MMGYPEVPSPEGRRVCRVPASSPIDRYGLLYRYVPSIWLSIDMWAVWRAVRRGVRKGVGPIRAPALGLVCLCEKFFFAERRRLFGPLPSRPTPRYSRSFRRRAVKTSASSRHERRPQSHKRTRPQTAGATWGNATNSCDGDTTHSPEDCTGAHRRWSWAANDPSSPGEPRRALAKRATPSARTATANSPISACAAAPSGTLPKPANGGRREVVRPTPARLDDAKHP